MTNPNIPQNPNQGNAQQNNIFATAYHGVIRNIAQARMNRAANVMERMDHKEALYSDLGHAALTGGERVNAAQRVELYTDAEDAAAFVEGRAPRTVTRDDMLRRGEFGAADTASGEPARPRSFGERWMDSRIEKRTHKKEIAAIYDRRNTKIYGTNDVSQLDGTTKWEKRAQVAGVVVDKYRGNLSPSEARATRNAIGAERLKLGKRPVTWSNSQLHKTDRRLDHSIDQPILARWRDRRRRRAINRIQSNHRRIERHS